MPKQPGGANFSGKNTIYKPKKDFAHRKRAQPRTSALPKLIFFSVRHPSAAGCVYVVRREVVYHSFEVR